jgi:phytol kinase
MRLVLAESRTVLVTRPLGLSEELRRELLRKGIHLLIALVPLLAGILGRGATLGLLGAGTVVYTLAETLRIQGHSVFLISRITEKAARTRDNGHFVLGPVTLGLGAMVALLIYPDPAATIAIYALAFGDSAASIIGKFAGMRRIRGTQGKTLEGAFGCFVAVLLVATRFGLNPVAAVSVGLVAAFTELLPLRDLDNLALPLTSGMTVVVALALT